MNPYPIGECAGGSREDIVFGLDVGLRTALTLVRDKVTVVFLLVSFIWGASQHVSPGASTAGSKMGGMLKDNVPAQ